VHIVVLGYIVRGPLGGLVWHHLQYVLSLKQMGHEVLFLEDSDNYASCYDPSSFAITTNPAYGLGFLKGVFKKFGLDNNWAYFDEHTNTWFGKSKQEVNAFCNKASVVLNLSGMNPVREWWCKIPNRAFIDTDPAFVQIRHLEDANARALASQHSHFFSFGENIGKAGCTIPNDGFHWLATRQPAYLPAWEVQSLSINAKWTSVMQWDSYAEKKFNGQTFGMKSLSFKELMNLPAHVRNEQIEIAMGSPTAPVEELKQKGWQIISSMIPTQTPWTYQQYIAASKGEWSVAKQGYVATSSGWFSERSLCYMASGKPVIVQDTGFTDFLEAGNGLLAFTNLREAIGCMEKVNKDYSYQCTQARRIVEENFEGTKVLNHLLNRL
jgi:hypothetical protein